VGLRAWRNRHAQKAHDAAERGETGAERKRKRCALPAGEDEAKCGCRSSRGLSDQARGRDNAAGGAGSDAAARSS